MKARLSPTFLLIVLLLAACTAAPAAPISPAQPPAATAAPGSTEAAPGASATPPDAADAPPTGTEPTTAPEPTLEPAPTEPSAENEFDPAVSPLFGARWDDRGAYAAGLLPDQQGLLDELPGAPVYHMRLDIADDMRTVTGKLALAYTNLEDIPLDEVYFHLYPNLLDGAITVENVTVDGQPVTPDLDPRSGHVMRVLLPDTLQPGEAAVFEMDFTSVAPTDIGRNYGIFAGYEGVLALAHFYPAMAVYDDDGWNVSEPDIQGDVTYSDTGYYQVEVTAPVEQVMAASGVAVDRREDGDTQTVTYAAGPMRDFYLAASETYEVTTERVGDLTINSYAPKGAGEAAAWTIDVGAAALESFSERFSAYPYAEFDIVATPTSALGIEYPGIIAVTNRIYDLNQRARNGVSFRDYVESTTAHEAAHQWFYGLVGNDQLDEPWLDEAMATFSTYLYYSDRYGPDAPQTLGYLENVKGRWARVDDEPIPVGMPVTAYDEAEYGAIVYGRGALFALALRDEMGQETFDRFLRDYFAANELGISDAGIFRSTAEAACDCDLGPLFAEWINQ